MFVNRAGVGAGALEPPERGAEELGLPQQPFGAAVDLGARGQASRGETLEIVQRLLAAAQLVIEIQHLDDEAGTKAEGGLGASRRRVARCAPQQDFTLRRGEQRRRAW